jgi:hypothetical protein
MKKIIFYILKAIEERSLILSWIRSRLRSLISSQLRSQRYGSGYLDPDPHRNVTDPQHWFPLLQATLHIRRVVPRPPAAGGLQAPGVLLEPLRG